MSGDDTFFEFSTFEFIAVHQHAVPEIILPSAPFLPPLFALSSWFRMEPNDRNGVEIHRYSSITLAGKNRFRNKTDTIPANNFDHGCTTGREGRGGEGEGGRGDFTLE